MKYIKVLSPFFNLSSPSCLSKYIIIVYISKKELYIILFIIIYVCRNRTKMHDIRTYSNGNRSRLFGFRTVVYTKREHHYPQRPNLCPDFGHPVFAGLLFGV